MSRLAQVARGEATGTILRTVPVADSAAGDGSVFTPPPGTAWELVSVCAVLTTDDGTDERLLSLTLTNGSRTLWSIPADFSPDASTATEYSFIVDYTAINNNKTFGRVISPLPPSIVLPGWQLTLGVDDAGNQDTLTAITLVVYEVFTGRREHDRSIERNIIDHADAIASAIRGEGFTA